MPGGVIRFGDEWGSYEEDALRKLYPEHGPSWGGWKFALPHRTVSAISAKAFDMHLSMHEPGTGGGSKWTPKEDAALRRLYPMLGSACADECPELAGRTRGAARKRAQKLGLRIEPITTEPPASNDHDDLPTVRGTWSTPPVRVSWYCPHCGAKQYATLGSSQLRGALAGTGATRVRCSGCGSESWIAGLVVKEERGRA